MVQRGYDELYIYSFDDVNNTLLLENTYELELSASYIDPWWGLALDEENSLLYLTDTSNRVHYYDISDWSLEGYIDIAVDSNDRRAIGIAVDPSSGYMYTGAFHGTGGYHQYLVRTELPSPYNSIEVLVEGDYFDQEAIGLGVDEDTGNVFVTTDDDDFRVYEPNLTLLDTEENDGIYSPAGVAVGGWYKTASFSLVKDNNDPNNECVRPFIGMGIEDNYLDFDICWDANGYADSNATLVDYLPKECDYYSSTPTGDYNSVDHTVAWDLGDITANDANCFFLRTEVNDWARPGGSFTNLVIMEGDTYLNEATCDVNVCAWGGEIIYVDKDANGYDNGTSWDDAYNLLQDGFTGARNCGAAVTAIWVAASTYKPVWEIDAAYQYMNESFDLIEDVGVFGHFGGVGTYETNTNQRNFSDPNNETILDGQIGDYYYEAVYDVLYADDIEDAIVDGFTIKNSYSGAGIYLNSSDTSIVNCKLQNNDSYGIECYNFSYPDIHNCTFIDNSYYGLYANSSCWPEVSNCVFDGNDTTSGGIYMTSYTVIAADNCVFKDYTGDGIYGSNGTLTVTNSTFEGNNDNGIEVSDITTTVTDCSIKNSNDNGIQASNSDLTVDHSVIAHCTDNGLYTSSGCNLTLKNSVVRYSGEDGIELNNNLVTTIKNNWIHNNGTDEYAYYGGAGISFKNQSSLPLVRNNTIYDNWTYGVESSENGADPNVINCIIYGNDSNDFYRENGTFDTVNYCNLQNPHSGTGNITGDPGLANVTTDPNDLHLAETSQCKDTGDINGDYDETDIDGESRICYGRVDMGGDEYYWSDADFDEDGLVNFIDYAVFAAAWQSDSGDVNYNEACDLEDNNAIDFDDLVLFCKDWLWEKAWGQSWMMCMGGGGFDSIEKGQLMMPDARTSLATRPERLTLKSEKFYAVNAFNTVSALQKAEQAKRQAVKEIDIKALIAWTEDLLADPNLTLDESRVRIIIDSLKAELEE